MKWSVLGLVFVGLIAAACATVLTAALRAGGLRSLVETRDVPSTLAIAVAARKLEAMTVVEAGDVVTRTHQREDVPEGHFTNPVQIIGKVVTVPLVEGQAFAPNSFAEDGSGVQLASALKGGLRAMSVSLTDYSGLYGVLYPGSMVDVLASFKLRSPRGGREEALSVTIMKGVQVLGIEHQTVVSKAREEGDKVMDVGNYRNKRWRVTLMVSPAQAQALQLVMEHGKIALAMRNPLDPSGEVQTDPTSLSALTRGTVRGVRSGFSNLYEFLRGGAGATESPTAASPGLPSRLGAGTSPAQPRVLKAAKAASWEIQIFRGGEAERVSLPLDD